MKRRRIRRLFLCEEHFFQPENTTGYGCMDVWMKIENQAKQN